MWLSRPLRHSVSQLPQQAFELWVLDSCGELLTSPKSSSPCWTSPILLPAEWRLVYSGAPRHTRSSHSSSGKAFSLFREYFCFSLVGGGVVWWQIELQWWVGSGGNEVMGITVPVLCTELQLRLWLLSFFLSLTLSWGWLQRMDFCQWKISPASHNLLGKTIRNWFSLHNKTRGSAAPGLTTLEAQQLQQIADYFHLFSDQLSLSSLLLS